MSTATGGTHQVTLSLTGLGATSRAYTSPSPEVSGWGSADGWALTTPANGTVTATADGLLVTSTVATVWVTKTVAVVAGKVRRVRARLRLNDPEGRPAMARITDNQSMTDTVSRMVSGVPVWIEGSHASDITTQVWIRIDRPAGATGTAVLIEAVTFDTEAVTSYGFTVKRQDANGTVFLAAGSVDDLDGSATVDQRAQWAPLRAGSGGGLTIVDREVSLVGTATYTVDNGAGVIETLTASAVSTGYGVLQRIATGTAPTMHQVNVIDYRGGRQATAQPLQVLGASLPNVPLQPLQAKAGTLVAYFDTLDAAEVVAADLATGAVFLLRQPALARTSMDTYLVAQSLDIGQELTDLTTPKWSLTVGYLQTARPNTWTP